MNIDMLLLCAAVFAAVIVLPLVFRMIVSYNYRQNCHRLGNIKIGLAVRDDALRDVLLSSFQRAGLTVLSLSPDRVSEGMASNAIWKQASFDTIGAAFIINVARAYGKPLSRLGLQECDFIEISVMYCNGVTIGSPFDIVGVMGHSLEAEEVAKLAMLRAVSVMAKRIARAEEIRQQCIDDRRSRYGKGVCVLSGSRN